MDAKRTQRVIFYTIGLAAIYAILQKKDRTGAASIGTSLTGAVMTVLNYKQAFKNKLIEKALDIQKRLGIDPNLLITQAALESNWGRSGLTQKDNNYFGMTAGSWIAKKLPVSDWPTTEYVNKPYDQVTYFETPGDLISKEKVSDTQTKIKVHRFFRHYDTMEASLDDWANLISGLSIYKDAYAAAQRGDLGSFATALQKAGYATDPKYAQTVVDFGAEVTAIV